MSPSPSITRLVLYVKDIPRVAAFYQKQFEFYKLPLEEQGWTELVSPANGLTLSFLQLGKGQKAGQSCVKFVFDVEDVAASKVHYGENGLAFGAIHQAEGYQFANARPSRELDSNLEPSVSVGILTGVTWPHLSIKSTLSGTRLESGGNT